MPRYFFGLYHWRRRIQEAAPFPIAIALGLLAFWLPIYLRLIVGIVAIAAARAGLPGVRKLFKPAPWAIQNEKYGQLLSKVDIDQADLILDFGCGTGRSLVGISSQVPHEATVIGVDRFDDEIILGNSPAIARRNVSLAGMSVEFLRGDGRRLPLRTNSVDTIIVSQVLHDLPVSTVDLVLSELARVCSPNGQLGLIELPLIEDSDAVEPAYWVDRIENAGFEVSSFETSPWKNGQERAIISAQPSSTEE